MSDAILFHAFLLASLKFTFGIRMLLTCTVALPQLKHINRWISIFETVPMLEQILAGLCVNCRDSKKTQS